MQISEDQTCSVTFHNSIRQTHRHHRGFSSTSQIPAPADTTADQDIRIWKSIPNTTNKSLSEYRFHPGQETTYLIPQKDGWSSLEREVSDRIFDRISRLVGDESTIKEIAAPAVVTLNEKGAYEEISAIFEAAIKELQAREERATQNLLKNYTRYTANPPSRALDVSLDMGESPLLTSEQLLNAKGLLPSKDVSSLPVDDFRVESQKHKEMFMKELELAQTDVAVWSALETHVFSLIETIKTRHEEEAKREKTQPGSKGASRKAPHRKRVRPKQDRDGNQTVPVSAASSSLSPSLPQLHSAPVSPEATLSIVQHNYGPCCLEALQLLRREFPASPYAQKILPTIKRLGVISYVLGATSSLYNELLYLLWTQYADLHGMADLLQEMRNRGVEQNGVTTALIMGV